MNRYIKKILLLFVILFSANNLYAQQSEISGRVIDSSSQDPIPYAAIEIMGTTKGTACNNEGYFTLKVSSKNQILRISAIGYRSKKWTIPSDAPRFKNVVIQLTPTTIQSKDEVLVKARINGKNPLNKYHPQKSGAVSQLMASVEGVSLIQRANYARQAVIRGMKNGQIGVLVDGMKIVGACVSGMDPSTAYVEGDNLKKIQVSKGAFNLNNDSNIGGSVNLQTVKPSYSGKIVSGNTMLSYEAVSHMRNIQTSMNFNQDKWAGRAAIIYRKAGDFRAGDGIVIHNSGYSKVNVNSSASRKIGDNKRLNIEYIGDFARNIGYPALIMDARKADADIASATLNWQPNSPYLHSINSKIYFNHIGHHMDDFNRNVMHRSVMPMMHMNMFGRTTTMGANEDLLFSSSTKSLGVHIHYYHLNAFGNMKMLSMMKGMSNKYMLNLGDVSLHQIENSINYNQQLSDHLQWTAEGRYTFSSRNITNSGERAYFEQKYNINTPQKNYSIYSVSTSLSYDVIRNTKLQLSLAKAQRVPTQIESYGHMIYNNTDGAFYDGNPELKPEDSYQAQLSLQSQQNNWGFKSDVYVNQLHNHIMGVIIKNSGGKKVKDYENITSAIMWGAEFRGWWKFVPDLKLYSNSSYTYGENLTLNEPLPLIPPLHGIVGLQYNKPKYNIDFNMHYATKQDRIAKKTTLEDITHGYTVYNVSASYKIYSGIRLIGGVDNIFDRYYHNHLSFGDLPNPGRNVYLTISANW